MFGGRIFFTGLYLTLLYPSPVQAQQPSEPVYRQYAPMYRRIMSSLKTGNPMWCHGFVSIPMGAQFYVKDGGRLNPNERTRFFSDYYSRFVSTINLPQHIEKMHYISGYSRLNYNSQFTAGLGYFQQNCLGSEYQYQRICVPLNDICTRVTGKTVALAVSINTAE